MARVINTLDHFVTKLNTLLELDSDPPSSGDEDYTVWTELANIAVNIWEDEEGMQWGELFGKLADAPDGTKTTTTATSYSVPSLFRYPASGYVWLGSGTNKTAFKVIRQADIQLYENDSAGRWCYFLQDGSPTLEFNPNLTIESGQTISYNYYKYANALTTGASTFEMSDPMYAVFFALAVLTKEEGNQLWLGIAEQKMEAMKTRNIILPEYQENTITDHTSSGFGV